MKKMAQVVFCIALTIFGLFFIPTNIKADAATISNSTVTIEEEQVALSDSFVRDNLKEEVPEQKFETEEPKAIEKIEALEESGIQQVVEEQIQPEVVTEEVIVEEVIAEEVIVEGVDNAAAQQVQNTTPVETAPVVTTPVETTPTETTPAETTPAETVPTEDETTNTDNDQQIVNTEQNRAIEVLNALAKMLDTDVTCLMTCLNKGVGHSVDSTGPNYAPLVNEYLAQSINAISEESWRVVRETVGYNIYYVNQEVDGMSDNTDLSDVYNLNTNTDTYSIGTASVDASSVVKSTATKENEVVEQIVDYEVTETVVVPQEETSEE